MAKNWRCPLCGLRFKSEESTKQHIHHKHELRTGKTGDPVKVERPPDEDLSEWQWMHKARGLPY